nr:hypothetical protein [Bacteroidota bacterium]
MAGSEIKTLLNNKFQATGEYHHHISFLQNLPHGFYFIVIDNGSANVGVKIVRKFFVLWFEGNIICIIFFKKCNTCVYSNSKVVL